VLVISSELSVRGRSRIWDSKCGQSSRLVIGAKRRPMGLENVSLVEGLKFGTAKTTHLNQTV